MGRHDRSNGANWLTALMGTEFSCDCGEDRKADQDATYDTEEGLTTTLGSEYEANTAAIRIKLTSLSESDGYAELCEGCTVEADERETVLEVLEKAALKLGLSEADAPSLQLQFKKQELAHGLEVQESGLRDGANGCVLGVDAVRTSKVCIFLAAHKAGLLRKYDAADIRLVCQHAPRRLNEKDKDDWTLLHKAAYINSPEIAELLLGAGATTDSQGNFEWTPLHVAAYKNSLEVAKLLLGAGAAIDAKGNFERTPLHAAASKNSLEVAALLVKAGAAIDARNHERRTALHVAHEEGSQEVASLLQGAGAAARSPGQSPRLPVVRFSSSPRGLSELAGLNQSSAPTVHGMTALRGSPINLTEH